MLKVLQIIKRVYDNDRLPGTPPFLGLAGLAIAFIIYHIMSRHNFGDGKVKKIGDQIHLGAMVFIKREYKMLSLFALAILVAIFVSPWA